MNYQIQKTVFAKLKKKSILSVALCILLSGSNVLQAKDCPEPPGGKEPCEFTPSDQIFALQLYTPLGQKQAGMKPAASLVFPSGEVFDLKIFTPNSQKKIWELYDKKMLGIKPRAVE